MAKYIDAERLKEEIKRQADSYQDTYTDSMRDSLLSFIDSLQQEPDKNLEEAAEKYRRASCNAAMKPNIDGPMPEYGGNIKTAFIAGAEWMKEQMMNDAVEGTLAGQLLSSLTENGKQMVITVPRNKFPSNPKTKSIKLIIVKEN